MLLVNLYLSNSVFTLAELLKKSRLGRLIRPRLCEMFLQVEICSVLRFFFFHIKRIISDSMRFILITRARTCATTKVNTKTEPSAVGNPMRSLLRKSFCYAEGRQGWPGGNLQRSQYGSLRNQWITSGNLDSSQPKHGFLFKELASYR